MIFLNESYLTQKGNILSYYFLFWKFTLVISVWILSYFELNFLIKIKKAIETEKNWI